MAKLSASRRKSLPKKDFAEPGKRAYPIENKSHARNALSQAAKKGGSTERRVKRAVKKKYPGIK